MKSDKLKNLQIDDDLKTRPTRSLWMIFVAVAVILAAALYFAIPRAGDDNRVMNSDKSTAGGTAATATGSKSSSTNTAKPSPVSAAATAVPGETVLTVSGYIVNRERIEISPRYQGVVKWIGVKKGDTVTNGQVVVLLDDTEYQARLQETQGRLESAHVGVAKAELDLKRTQQLVREKVEMSKLEDDARLDLEARRATVKELEGSLKLAQTYLDWTIISSPINGVVLEKLVDPNEIVVPQSFGGTRGPSTALIALADPQDLQVEIDLNEGDLAKVSLNQKCRVSPEAYPDKVYEGYVAEMAPEASRAKGTLQIKVQIRNPDKFLTPELSAKVDFLAGEIQK